MNVLVDTSIWSLALRRSSRQRSKAERRLERELASLITQARVVLIGPIRQEILSGVQSDVIFEQLRQYLEHFHDEVLTKDDYVEAARCYNLARAAGITGSAVDVLICAAAVRRNLAVFTSDADFDGYALHYPLRLHQPS